MEEPKYPRWFDYLDDVFPVLYTVLPHTLLKDITRAYSEPWRRYHTLQHLKEMLGAWAWVSRKLGANFLSGGTTIAQAILYHDFVYVPGHPDNEMMSAIANHEAQTSQHDDERHRVRELILATRNHWTSPDGDTELNHFLDCDLVGFAATSERYCQISSQLYEELGHLPDYGGRRICFLKNLLTRKSIFRTSTFRDDYEEKAKENVEAELRRLL